MKNFFKKKLRNGLIVLFEKRELPIVSFSISNRFGAGFETSEIKGIAHFIEHLLFTGTKTRTYEDISREIEKKGGILNAFTSHEITSFWFKLPSEHLFAGIDILADILKNAVFKEDKFEKEKKVILEEIKMYHDMPMRYVFELIEKCLYEKPFGETIIGNEKTISSLKREQVFNYFKKNYAPSNFIVTIVGNAEFDEVCEYLEKVFSENKKKLEMQKIKLKNDRKIEERDGLDQAHFLIGMHAPLFGTRENYALGVLDAYLANGMSSKLFLKIREEKGLTYSVKSDIACEKSYSHYTIYVGTRKEAIEEVEKDIINEFKNVEKMGEKDLKEAKERLLGLRKLAAEESDNVMNQLLFAELSGKAEEYYSQEEKIKDVKLEEVKKLARELIKEYSVAAIVPK